MSGADIGLSFLEGIALIASPCILPVLPLVLSASIDGGKARPFGITTGFVLAFSIFVLLSRQLVEALHISPDIIRTTSLVLLALFGFVLLSEKLSGWFSLATQSFANIGVTAGQGGGGFASGLGIGALIGLVWTPCAGPILAAVLVQAIRQQTDLQSIFVTLGFAFGAGLPMLAISLLGRDVLKHTGFLTKHTEIVRKIFGVLILISVALLAFGDVTPVPVVAEKPQPIIMKMEDALEKPLDKPYPAPEFTGIKQWLNSDPLTMASLRGKVVLVDFWTYSCINCVRTLPYLTQWDAKYRDKGLVIIGVHAPEFEFEKNVDNVQAALAAHDIHYPVAIDNNLDTWTAFNNQYWPAHYLIDKDGQVVYTHFGEGDYDVTENNIRYLLGITGKVKMEDPTVSTDQQTRETYLGTKRAENFAGTLMKGDLFYRLAMPDEHHWSLGGHWKIQPDKIIAGQDGHLRLNFTARKVFLVMGTTDGQPHQAMLTLDGQALGANAGQDAPDGSVIVTAHTLYELVDQHEAKNGILDIDLQPGTEAYAFTFGN
jgi:cytochrome c biogenesis protein CcdA/thiol-disulfide isomerase/thioredoxin